MNEIDITGLDAAQLLADLYNAARPIGMGFLQARDEPMTRDDAQGLLSKTIHFDYVHGRPLKLTFDGNTLRNVRLYDRDQGEGKCARVVAELRARTESGA